MINLPNLSSMERNLHKLELVLERFGQPFFLILKTPGQTSKSTCHDSRRCFRILRYKEILTEKDFKVCNILYVSFFINICQNKMERAILVS